jgi:hypothetical protein
LNLFFWDFINQQKKASLKWCATLLETPADLAEHTQRTSKYTLGGLDSYAKLTYVQFRRFGNSFHLIFFFPLLPGCFYRFLFLCHLIFQFRTTEQHSRQAGWDAMFFKK